MRPVEVGQKARLEDMTTMQHILATPSRDADDRQSRGERGLRVPVVDCRIQALLQHWLDIRDGGAVPDRRRFDPIRVASVLSHFWILQRDPESGCWRFALAGENTLRLLGRKLIGENIEDVFPDQAARFYEKIDAVVSTPAVLHMVGPMYRTDRAPVEAERLSLPMRDGAAIDRIYGATVYRWPSASPGGAARYEGNVDMTIVPVAKLGAGG